MLNNKPSILQTRFSDPMNIPTGSLKINVFNTNIANPIEDANIRIFKTENPNITIENIKTNSSGQTLNINLMAPPKEYSLKPEVQFKPYEKYSIEVTANGFIPKIIEGIEIFQDVEAIQNVELELQKVLTREEHIISIKDHTLWEMYDPKIPENEIKDFSPNSGLVVLNQIVIPETIVVHDGHPNNTNAKNYYIPFKDYIKNVVSSEIYATWPNSTIRANTLAIISFALNRVYTEWYRNKLKNFTITSSTAYDQAFFYGRNIYSNISLIVDELFTTYISRPNIEQPLFTQYCDGKKVSCPQWMPNL